MQSTGELRFGRFQLQRRQRRLLIEGVPVELGARAVDVLLALVDADGAPLGKDELISRVWGMAVEEHNLTVQIHALRKALGPDREMIRTVPRHGYAFIGDLEEPLATPAADAVSIRATDTNVPAQVEALIGRDGEIQELLTLQGTCRLLTLTGAGGIGKTRLALELAWLRLPSFSDGIWFAELATLSDASLVPGRIAVALGLQAGDSAQAVAAAVGGKNLLLVLDNCEHVVGEAARAAEALLHGTRNVQIVATSREPLRAESESVYRVPALATPAAGASDAAEILRHGAVRLFIARAGAADSRFRAGDAELPAISTICRRLDGIPLAIELAAARAPVLGLDELLGSIDDSFALLTGGRRTALPRHRTLQATLDWSHDLLGQAERVVLRRLAVFAGFTLKAASAVAQDTELAAAEVVDCVSGLIAKSLISSETDTLTARYRLLETTRAYAIDKLAKSGEREPLARRHAEYFRDLFERANNESETRATAEWLAVYALETDNVRAALNWAFSPGGDTTIGVALLLASERLWFGLSLLNECRRRVGRALSSLQLGAAETPALEMRLKAILAAALFNTKGPGPEAYAAWTEVLETAERLGDTECQLRGIWGLWYHHLSNGELRAALALAQRHDALPADKVNPVDLLVGERMIATSLQYLGELGEARRHVEYMLSHCTPAIRRAHMNRFQFDLPVSARGTFAKVLWLQGLPDQAMRMASANVEDARVIDREISVSVCWALDTECMVGLEVGELATVERSVAVLLEYAIEHALVFWQALGESYKGQLLIKRGDLRNGVECLRAGIHGLREARYVLRAPGLLGALAAGLAAIGEVSPALKTIDEALAECERTDERWIIADLLRIKAEILLSLGAREAEPAEDLFRQALDWARRQGALSLELRAAMSLARLLRDSGRRGDATALFIPVYERITEGFGTADAKAARGLLDELRDVAAD